MRIDRRASGGYTRVLWRCKLGPARAGSPQEARRRASAAGAEARVVGRDDGDRAFQPAIAGNASGRAEGRDAGEAVVRPRKTWSGGARRVEACEGGGPAGTLGVVLGRPRPPPRPKAPGTRPATRPARAVCCGAGTGATTRPTRVSRFDGTTDLTFRMTASGFGWRVRWNEGLRPSRRPSPAPTLPHRLVAEAARSALLCNALLCNALATGGGLVALILTLGPVSGGCPGLCACTVGRRSGCDGLVYLVGPYASDRSMTQVVFACVHNAGRSQMAAALLTMLADPSKCASAFSWTKRSLRRPGRVFPAGVCSPTGPSCYVSSQRSQP